MSIYKVKKYEPLVGAHRVVEEGDDEENWLYLDLMLMTEGEMEEEDFVGKRVEVGRLKRYLMIAQDIEVL